jgi:DNA-binding response OmpR family regulator
MSSSKSLTILFVEDEKELRDALVDAVGDEFAKFIVAFNGDDGLKKFKKFKPDIVVTDIMMPISSGLEMAKEIKRISRETPVIVLSAFSERERLLRAIDAGVDKYLMKPIDMDELMLAIEYIASELLSYDKIIEIGGGYQFDKNKKVLIRDKKTISLTRKELLFITILIKNLGAFVLHEEIKKYVWTNKSVTDAAIRTFIKRVREKTNREFIKNVPGLGYRINCDF